MVLIEAFKVKVNVMHLHYLTHVRKREKEKILYEYPSNKISKESIILLSKRKRKRKQ
jgi:hypothetical protein